MITDQQFYLDELYEHLNKIEQVFGKPICLVLATNGCGRIESDEDGWLISWNSLEQGYQELKKFYAALKQGLTHEQYIDSLES